jgi:uncharacterized peroxidase-related enzyme
MKDRNRPFFKNISDNPQGIVSVFMQRPNKYRMLLTLAQEVLREESHLSPVQREVIAAYTSKLNGCDYCRGSHTAFAESIGASKEDVEAIKTGEINNHPMYPILSYVKKLTLSPNSISEFDRVAVLEAGFSEEQLKDAIGVCAAFNLFNRIVEGHGVLPQDNYDQDVKMINEHGYDFRK